MSFNSNRSVDRYDLCQNFEPSESPEHRRHNGYVGLHPTPKHRNFKKLPDTWKIIVSVLLLCALFITGLLLGYYIRHKGAEGGTSLTSRPPCLEPQMQKWDPRRLEQLHENLMYSMSGDVMAASLSNYTFKRVFSGSQSDSELVNIVQNTFQSLGFDNVQLKKYNNKYDVLLSFPDKTQPNVVQFVRDNNVMFMEPNEEWTRASIATTMQKSAGVIAKLQALQELERRMPQGMGRGGGGLGGAMRGGGGRGGHQGVDVEGLMEPQPYVAYSPPGMVQGEVVYVNHGCHDDFMAVRSHGITLRDKVVLLRFGKCSIREKLREAEHYGISGALLYPDPADAVNPLLVQCDTVVPFASANDEGVGDPSTPGYPSIDGMLRVPVSEADLPTIPVQTISCRMAQTLLQNMTGLKAPKAWQGDIPNLTYYIGRKSHRPAAWSVRLIVNNQFVPKTIYNVIGTLTGEEEPDHYVIVGASRNSFNIGEEGGTPGTSMLLEFAKKLAVLVNRDKWHPKRTIRLVSWGGAEFGHLGMNEFIQEYKDVLSGRIVTYVNLDHPVVGNYSLGATASPILHDILYNSARRVPSPDELQMMAYDTWQDRSESHNSRGDPSIETPYQTLLGGTTDPFYTQLGTTTTRVQYMPRPHMLKSPNATVYEMEAQHRFRHHTAVGRVVGLLTLSLADASILQFDLERSARLLQNQILEISPNIRNISNDTADALVAENVKLISAARAMHHFIMTQADFSSPIQRRMLNERLLHCEQLITYVLNNLVIYRSSLQSSQMHQSSTSLAANSSISSTASSASSASSHKALYRELSQLLNNIQTATQTLKVEV